MCRSVGFASTVPTILLEFILLCKLLADGLLFGPLHDNGNFHYLSYTVGWSSLG